MAVRTEAGVATGRSDRNRIGHALRSVIHRKKSLVRKPVNGSVEMIGVRALRVALMTVWTVGQLVSQPLGATEQGRVRIEMVGVGGERLTGERYIALVAEGKPVREPIEEALLEADALSVTWSVPPGRYRAVCSETSHWWAEGRRFEVGAGEDFEALCELRPLVPVEGRVLSGTNGEPVADARVGFVHGFLEDFRLRLSALGERHAAPARTTRTDSDGRFVLRGPVDAKVPVWVEADGFEPRLLPGVEFPGDGVGALEPIGLDPGGRLRLEVTLPDGLERERYRVGLILLPGKGGAAVDHGWRRAAEQIWATSIPEVEGDAVELRWASLPAGSLEVWLVPREVERQDLALHKLGVVDLGPGRETTATLSLEAAGKVGGTGFDRGSRTVGILLGDPIDELAVLRWRTGWRQVESSTVARSGGVEVLVPGACSEGETLVLSAPGAISAPIHAAVGECEIEAPAMYEAATVAGGVSAPRGGALPADAELVVFGCDDPVGGRPVLGAYPVVFAQDGAWSAVVPAGCIDLELRPFELAPEEWQGLELVAGTRKVLDDRVLEHASGLVARIVSSTTGLGIAGADVTLVKESDLEAEVKRSFSPVGALPGAWSAETDSLGRARFDVVPAGHFVLRIARQGDKWPHFSFPVAVGAGERKVLEDVRFPERGRLEVQVVTEDGATADELALEVFLKGAADCGWIQHASFSAAVDRRGSAVLDEVPPGTWDLTLLAVGDEGARQPLAGEFVDVLPGDSRTVEVKLAKRIYRGRVLYRGRPQQGVVELQAESSSTPERTRARTDEDGEFTAPLSTPGPFTVRFSGLEARRTSAVGNVLFSEDPDALTEIELPEGQIEGSVLSSGGRGVSGATVIAEQVSERQGGGGSHGPVTSHLTVNTKSDARGAFVLDSLGAGEWTLRARLGEERSAPQTTSLAPGEVAAGVALTLEDRDQLLGRVLDSYGQGVSRASGIGVVPSASANGVPEIVRFATADDGSFEVDRVGIRGQPVNFTVVAPGQPVFAVRESLDDGLEIQVPAIGGGVELAGDDGIWVDLRLNQLALVDGGGAFVQLSALGNRLERRSSESLVVDNLAEGRWHLVVVGSLAEFQVLVGGQGLALTPLATFKVVGGQWSRAEVGPSRQRSDSR